MHGQRDRRCYGSGFMKCDFYNKHIPMVLFDMYDCKLEDKIWSKFADASKETKHVDTQKALEEKKENKMSTETMFKF
jgi:hypothetical protein